MILQQIKIVNFLSIKEINLKFSSSNGIVLIEGKNLDANISNGSGKSAILDAIYWCLTGKTLRKSTEETLINAEAKKGLEVTLVGDTFTIHRGKKPTFLKFTTKEGVKTKASAIETQVEIDKYLHTNYKLLAASMFLGQHNDLTFLDATADEKRTIIRNFLNLEELFSKRDKIKDLKSEYLTKSKEYEAAIKQNNLLMESNNKKLEEVEKNKSLLGEFEGVTVTLEEVLEAEEHNRDSTERKQNGYKTIRLLTKEREETLYLINYASKCKECGSTLKENTHEQDVQALKRIKEIDQDLETQQHFIDLLTWKHLPVKSSNLVQYTEYLKLVSNASYMEETNMVLENQIKNLDLERQKVLKLYEVMKFWERAFSEHGIIKYIIKNVLAYFNTRCNYYLSLLSSNKYFILFDEELEEKISTNGIFIHYISLSGGEKRKVNLAVLLGLKDLLTITNKSSSNLLCFDEITDFIDDESMPQVVQLLHELKKTKLIYLITHNKQLKELLDSHKRIVVHKKNNESYLAK